MRKKFLWVLLACVLAFSLAAFTACEADMADKNAVRAESVSLNETSLSLSVGQTFQLTATPTPADTTEDIRWSVVTTQTSGTNIATVSPDGLVTAVSAGTATIQVQVGTAKATCTVTVTDNGGGTEPEPPAYTKLVGYSVQDNAFTDGETAVSGGTIVNNGFKADMVNSVYVENPYYNETVTSASIVVEFYIGSATLENWAPLWGIKDSGNGFLALVVNGDGQLQLSYNAYSPVGTDNNYFDQSLGAPTVGTHTLLISIADDGSLDIYYDNGTAPLASIDLDAVYNVAEGDTYAASGETVDEYLLQAERLYFFGGAWGELSVSGDTWTWTGLPWAGNFNGSIVSCDFYSGIIPVSKVFGA